MSLPTGHTPNLSITWLRPTPRIREGGLGYESCQHQLICSAVQRRCAHAHAPSISRIVRRLVAASIIPAPTHVPDGWRVPKFGEYHPIAGSVEPRKYCHTRLVGRRKRARRIDRKSTRL